MKTCPVCALDVEDTYSFCPEDGASLRDFNGLSEIVSPQSDVEVDTPRSVVLYCPTCAAEYPLTFTECPVHGVKLTKHNVSRLLQKADPSPVESEPDQAETTTSFDGVNNDLAHYKQQASEHVIEAPTLDTGAGIRNPQYTPTPLSRVPRIEPNESEPATDADELLEQPGFRIAAIATVIGLSVFALVALVAVFSNLSRRPSTPVARLIEASPPPFIPTPKEAQDYAEPSPAVSPTNAPESRDDRATEPKSEPKNKVPSSRSEHVVSGPAVAKSDPEPRQPRPSTNVSTSPPPPLPRGNAGGFDARLIRVRSSKTPSGVRYDLTFNMQEQAGRGAQWQRVLITTRSASGTDHSQAIPFAHRLGAAGALTFTISVELAGRSEADWHGRVVCTTLGWDNRGAPLQASFGANLTP